MDKSERKTKRRGGRRRRRRRRRRRSRRRNKDTPRYTLISRRVASRTHATQTQTRNTISQLAVSQTDSPPQPPIFVVTVITLPSLSISLFSLSLSVFRCLCLSVVFTFHYDDAQATTIFSIRDRCSSKLQCSGQACLLQCHADMAQAHAENLFIDWYC